MFLSLNELKRASKQMRKNIIADLRRLTMGLTSQVKARYKVHLCTSIRILLTFIEIAITGAL